MNSVKRSNVYFLIIILLQIFVSPFLIVGLQSMNITDMKILLVINHTFLFIIPAIVYFIITKKNIRETLSLKRLKISDAGLILLLAIVIQPFITFCSLITSFFFENDVAEMMESISSAPYLVLLFVIAVLPSITEEITIRGIILDGYKKMGIISSAIFTGIIFGIFHLNGQQLLYTIVLGFVMSLLVRITGSIFSSALLHFLINGTSVTIQKVMSLFPEFTESASDVSLMTMPIGQKISMLLIYAIPAMISASLCILILYQLLKMNKKRNIEIINNDIRYKEEKVAWYKAFDIPLGITIILYVIFIILLPLVL